MTVRESILANIKTVLAGVTTGNGYDNTLASVQRWRQDGNTTFDIPCVFIAAGPETKNVGPNPNMTCRLTIFIGIWTRQEKINTDPSDAILNSLLGDIEKALMLDVTRGGYARDTNILSNEPFDSIEGQPDIGLMVQMEVLYQHLQTDPEVSG